MDNVHLRWAESEHDKRAAYSLRYQVFGVELGRKQYANHVEQTFTDSADERSHILIGEIYPGKVVCTLRITLGSDGFLHEDEVGFKELILSKGRNRVAVTDRGAIDQAYRGYGLYPPMWDAIIRLALQYSIETLLGVIDAKNRGLNAFHRRARWRNFRDNVHEAGWDWNYIYNDIQPARLAPSPTTQ